MSYDKLLPMSETENKPARQSLTLQASAGGKEYEMSYLLNPEIAEDKVETETAELNKVISDNGGAIVDSLPAIKRRLAYPIKKQNQAYFGVIYFISDTEELNKIKQSLALNKKLIRFLILNEPLKPKVADAAVVKPKESRPQTQSFDQKLESILKG